MPISDYYLLIIFFFSFQISKLYKRILKIVRPYYDAIGKLNIEEGPEKQLKEAREAYREGRASALPGKYTKEFNKLKRRIVSKYTIYAGV